jgi:hypothetical protein
MSADMLCAVDDEAALELLHELGCTDGLPVVVPTRQRVDRMVLAGGVDPELSLGTIGPLQGEATVEKVAAAAVMAGCLPDYFPVVLAVARAACDPKLDLTEIQATTHSAAPLIIVNGPVRGACGIASGTGALGPGYRANATIGRALRLMLVNLGGGRPGISDMSLLGHPGKFTYCIGEAEEESPLPPLHTSFGYDAEQSTVTLVCVDAPHSVICAAADDDFAGRLVKQFAAALSYTGSNNTIAGKGAQVLILNPLHAEALTRAGFDRRALQVRLAELAVRPASEIYTRSDAMLAESGRVDDSGMLHAVADPSDLVIIVAGGGGNYDVVIPSWAAGTHHNTSVTYEVVIDQACEVPWAVASATSAGDSLT